SLHSFLEQQTRQIAILEGSEQEPLSEIYFQQFLKHPWLQQKFTEENPSYHQYLKPFARYSIQQFFYQQQLTKSRNFLDLVNFAICFAPTIDTPILLLCNRIFSKLFGSLYTPATFLQKLQIFWLGPSGIEKLKNHRKRKQYTQDALLQLKEIHLCQLSAPPTSFIRKGFLWLWKMTLLPFLLQGIRLFFQKFELAGPFLPVGFIATFQQMGDRVRLQKFSHHYQHFRKIQSQGHFASLFALNESFRIFEEIGGRYPLAEAETFAEILEKEFQDQLRWVLDQILRDLHLPEKEQDLFGNFIRHLVYTARNQRHPLSRYILIDLERSFSEGRRQLFWLSWKRWFFSKGKQSLTQPILFCSQLRRLKYLKRIVPKIARLSLTPEQYSRYSQVLGKIISRLEQDLQRDLKQTIAPLFQEIGLIPKNYHEKIALLEIQDEMTHQIVEEQQLHFTQLRDILSRNDFKLQDWTRLSELGFRDVFSRLDAQLKLRLKGIYQPGEFYLKFLHLLTGIFFGTPLGRVLCKFFFFPFGFSFCALAFFQFFIFPYSEWTRYSVLLSSRNILIFAGSLVLIFFTWPGRRLFRLLLEILQAFVEKILFLLKFFFYLFPHFVIHLFNQIVPYSVRVNILSPVTGSLLFWFLMYQYVLPQEYIHTIWHPIVSFALMTILLYLINPLWQIFKRKLRFFTVDMGRIWFKNICIAFFKFILHCSHRAFLVLEKTIYGIEQRLRLQQGEWSGWIVVKSFLAFIWFWPTAITRFYVRLFLEPQVNPLKFPVVSLTYKVWFPIAMTFIHQHETALNQLFWPKLRILDYGLAYWIVQVHAFIFTGFFGFLVWELKKNWDLYHANRSLLATGKSVLNSGETLPQLLFNGPRSGKIPALYQKLRRLLQYDLRGTDSFRIRQVELVLQNLTQKVELFFQKNLLYALNLHPEFLKTPLKIESIHLLISGIDLIVSTEDDSFCFIHLHFEMKEEILYTSTFLSPSAETKFSSSQKLLLDLAIFLLYKRANVSFCEEQIAHFLEQRYTDKLQNAILPQKVYFSFHPPHQLFLQIPIEGFTGWKEVSYKIVPKKVRAKQGDLSGEPFDFQKIIFATHSLFWKDYNWLMEASDITKEYYPFVPFLSRPPPTLIKSTLAFS
ncbi:MAG: hypothetical protein AABZ60_13445, partial [Planctomycetota bacterium]